MKRILSILFSVLLFGYLTSCKEEFIEDPPPIDSIPDTIPDTTGCNPVIRSLTVNDLSFLQFCDTSSISFINQDNYAAIFTNILNVHDTSFDCSSGHEYWILNYGCDSINWRIIYDLRSTYNSPYNLKIRVGPPTSNGQFYQTYEIGTDSSPYYDTLLLSTYLFTNVYKAHPMLSNYPDLYFTKAQGVVGFYDFSGNFWVWKE